MRQLGSWPINDLPIRKIVKLAKPFRDETGANICFTLDAGPNVHILYLKSDKELAVKFINEQIKPLCHDEVVIHDQMGNGPVKC